MAGSAEEPAGSVNSVTVVITNYNGRECLPRTLECLFKNGQPIAEVIVVDDGSTDDIRNWLRHHWPSVRVVGPDRNMVNPCVVRNWGLRLVRTRYAFLMDNDISIEPGCIAVLLAVMQSNSKILCLTPRLIDEDDRQRIYADGNACHFLGLSGRPARQALVAECEIRAPFATFGGGIMLIDMQHASALKLFDEDYLRGWGNDAEFQQRGRLMGLEALHVSAAVCGHTGKEHGANRAYGQMHNRYRFMLSYYRVRTLFLLAPSFLMFEVMLTAAALTKGFSRDRIRALGSIWIERKSWLAARRILQSRRSLPDRSLLCGGPFEAPGALPGNSLYRRFIGIVAWCFDLNWRLVRRWL